MSWIAEVGKELKSPKAVAAFIYVVVGGPILAGAIKLIVALSDQLPPVLKELKPSISILFSDLVDVFFHEIMVPVWAILAVFLAVVLTPFLYGRLRKTITAFRELREAVDEEVEAYAAPEEPLDVDHEQQLNQGVAIAEPIEAPEYTNVEADILECISVHNTSWYTAVGLVRLTRHGLIPVEHAVNRLLRLGLVEIKYRDMGLHQEYYRITGAGLDVVRALNQ